MSNRPRKFTTELARERAVEILRMYETGVGPKDIAARYGQDTNWVWARIQHARRIAKGAAE